MWLTRILAAYFPDEGIRVHKAAMKRVITTVQDLVHQHRANIAHVAGAQS